MFCIIFGPAGRIRGFGPRGAGTIIRALRQAAASLKKANAQARSAGSTLGSAKNNPLVMVACPEKIGHGGLTRK